MTCKVRFLVFQIKNQKFVLQQNTICVKITLEVKTLEERLIKLGSRIRELRKAEGMSQKELALNLGVSTSAVGMYEQGRREPDSEKLSGLCEIFGVTMDYLLGRSETARSVPETNDIVEAFDQMTNDILERGGLMFDGKPIEREEVERVVEAMRLGMMLRLHGSDGGKR